MQKTRLFQIVTIYTIVKYLVEYQFKAILYWELSDQVIYKYIYSYCSCNEYKLHACILCSADYKY